jgi:hypothetical protein
MGTFGTTEKEFKNIIEETEKTIRRKLTAEEKKELLKTSE